MDNHETESSEFYALLLAAGNGDEQAVVQTLPRVHLLSSLHRAISEGHDGVVAQLLAHDPSLGNEGSVLEEAVRKGHEKIVVQLLRHSCPSAVMISFCTVLSGGFSTMIFPFLDHDATLAEQVGVSGDPPIISAARYGWEKVIDRMLSFKPALAFARSYDSTLLQAVLGGTRRVEGRRDRSFYSPELSERIWNLNPQALYEKNEYDQTAFSEAVENNNTWAINFFTWKMSIDDLLLVDSPFDDLRPDKRLMWRNRLTRLVERQLETLVECLVVDTIGIIRTYIGLESEEQTRRHNEKRRNRSEEESEEGE